MVETSYIELCFVLPVFLQNLHSCFFLSMLLIPYYTTVFRGQSQNRWYKTVMSAAMLLNNILNLLASGIPFSNSCMHSVFRYSESTDLYFTQFKLKYCQLLLDWSENDCLGFCPMRVNGFSKKNADVQRMYWKKIPVVFTNVTNHNFWYCQNFSDLGQSLKDHNVKCTIC